MEDRIVGILGGMGPKATVDLLAKIVEETHAKTEQDDLRIIIDNNPKMPSRQEAILNGGESPVPVMIETARNIERAGADFLILGANTPHYYFDEIASAIHIPMIHIIDEAVKDMKRRIPGIKKVGVLATSAAAKACLYESSCRRFGVDVVAATAEEQDIIQESFYTFKFHGRTAGCVKAIRQCGDALIARGAESLIMGCTEFPVILSGEAFTVPLTDPNDIIARVVVAYAKHRYDPFNPESALDWPETEN